MRENDIDVNAGAVYLPSYLTMKLSISDSYLTNFSDSLSHLIQHTIFAVIMSLNADFVSLRDLLTMIDFKVSVKTCSI